jgi:two-component system phosphate regulon response regulator PhoB
MQVSRGGENIHLGPKEYHLLALMMESPERVFSREQLLDRVWGHGIYVEDRTVDVHMSRLRRALKAADPQGPKTVVIRTVRGTGYALSRAEK